MPDQAKNRELPALILGLLLTAIFFIAGLSQPPEVASNIGIVTAIIVGLLARSRRLVMLFVVLGVTLVMAGSLISPSGIASLVTPNELLALFLIASVGGTCYLALSEQDRLNAKLRQAAERDPLTGLANRRVMMQQLILHLRQARRYQQPLSVIILDVDDFKVINDEYGHLAGDEVLRRLSTICASCLREADVLCRFGGEEFAIVCPMTDLAGAMTAAERIRQEVAAHRLIAVDPGHPVTASIGVATLDDHNQSEEALLKLADDGLYQAKREGKDRVLALQYPQAVDNYADRERISPVGALAQGADA